MRELHAKPYLCRNSTKGVWLIAKKTHRFGIEHGSLNSISIQSLFGIC